MDSTIDADNAEAGPSSTRPVQQPFSDDLLDPALLEQMNLSDLPNGIASNQTSDNLQDWLYQDPNFSFTEALHADNLAYSDEQHAERGPLDAIIDFDEDAEGEFEEEYDLEEDGSEYVDEEGDEEGSDWENDEEAFEDSDLDIGNSDVDDDVARPGGDIGEQDIDNQITSFHNDLHAGIGFRKRLPKGKFKQGRRAIQDMEHSHEVQILLGQANQFYASGDYGNTLSTVQRVIQIDASVYFAWKVMGEVYLETGDPRKCLLSWISAAHLRSRENPLWVTCARMTLDLETENTQDEEKVKEEAIYLYSQAIKANSKDYSSIFERASLLQECQKFKRAIADYKRLLEKALPHDTNVVKSLSQCYLGLDRVDEAIGVFESSISFWKERTGDPDHGLEWRHVNMLGDIYWIAQKWMEGIKRIKNLSRWLCGRSKETYWENSKNDCEWDEENSSRRIQVSAFVKGPPIVPGTHSLPPELRCKLGQLRLKLKQFDEGMRHFDILQKSDIEQNGDLLLVAGDACVGLSKHDEAIGLWVPLSEVEEFQNAELWMRLGKSYKALRNWENAKSCLECVIQCREDDVESRLLLIEIYELLDLNDEALETVNDVIELRSRQRQLRQIGRASVRASIAPQAQTGLGASRTGLFVAKDKKKRSRVYNPTASERYQAEKQRTELCLENYQKLELLRWQVENEDRRAIREWLETAGEMFDDFRSSRALYPSERRHEYVGFLGYSTARRNHKQPSLESQMTKTKRRLESNLEYQLEIENQNSDQVQPDITQYRGLGFDIWLNILLNYAVLLTKYEEGGAGEAYEVCKATKDANVFYHDKRDPDPTKRPSFLILLVHLACAVYAQDPEQTSDCLRIFMTTRLFHDDSYRLYTTISTFVRVPLKQHPGQNIFSVQNNQKYFMRQLKALDKYALGKPVIGAYAALLKDDNGKEIVPDIVSIEALVLYAQIMLDGRSYSHSLHYLVRAYHIQQDSPMIIFEIALAYLHRAMQRQSENRQYHILQGLVFLFKYYEMRKDGGDWFDIQEAEFNMGRAFHQIGLEHYAIGYYEKVLEMSEEKRNVMESKISEQGGNLMSEDEDEQKRMEAGDLRWEAAYNLQLIYFTVGGERLCDGIAERYMVI